MIVVEGFAEANARPIRVVGQKLGVSWDKTIAHTGNFFILDVSVLDGPDVLGFSGDRPFNPAHAYEMSDTTSFVESASLSRSVQFPYGIQSATADFDIINHDKMFSGAPFIYAARPVRFWCGIAPLGNQTPTLVPLFEGFTDGSPDYSGTDEQSFSLTAFDLLSTLCNQTLPNMLLSTEVRTDELIRQILVDELGVEEYLLDLERGQIVIPFAWFEAGKSVGEALKEIVQAENGILFVNENGIITYRVTGLNELTAPAVATFDAANIISVQQSGASDIVNECHIEAEIREVQTRQVVYIADNDNGFSSDAETDTMRLQANATTDIWIDLEDPATSVDLPLIRTARSDVASYLIAVNLGGLPRTTGLSVDGYLFGNRYLLRVKNSNSFALSILQLRLWGTPAKVVQTVNYTASVAESVAAFGRSALSITDNKLWGSAANIKDYAAKILQANAEFGSRLELDVRSDIRLQIGDVVEVRLQDWEQSKRFAVAGVKIKMSQSNCAIKQTLSLVATAEEE